MKEYIWAICYWTSACALLASSSRILLSSAIAASCAAVCAAIWAYIFLLQCYNAKQIYIHIKWTMNKSGFTSSSCTRSSAADSHGRMGGALSVFLARIWTRVGVEAVSSVPSPIKYRPCFFPPPTLMMTSPSRSWALGSQSGPWTYLPAFVYILMRAWTEGLEYAEGGSSGL